MPRNSNSESNSNYSNISSDSSHFEYPDILDQVQYPIWDFEEVEEELEETINAATTKKILTRKMLNNAIEYALRNKPQELAAAKKKRKTIDEHVTEGNLLDVKQYLDDGANVNQKFGGNLSLIQLALLFLHRNPLPMIKLLLDYGADINHFSNDNKTPLHYALEDNMGEGAFSKQIWQTVNYLLDRGALLYPHPAHTMLSQLAEARMKDVLMRKTGKETITLDEQRDFLEKNGIHSLNMYYGAEQLMDRISHLEDDHVRGLKFSNLASSEIKTLFIDERGSVRVLKEYVKYTILKMAPYGDVDLLVKQGQGKPDRILDTSKTIKEEGLNEDVIIKIVPKLKTGNVLGGRRTRTRKNLNRK